MFEKIMKVKNEKKYFRENSEKVGRNKMAVEKKVRRYKTGNNRKIDSRRVRKRVSHESRDK